MRRLLLLPLLLLMADVTVQRGETTIASGETTATITAGTDYDTPSGSAFIRLVNTLQTSDGQDGQAGEDVAVWTATIQDPDNLGTSITFARPASDTNSVTVQWEIWEYTGSGGGGNECIVRHRELVTVADGNSTASSATVSGVSEDDDVVVFICGQDNATTNNAIGTSLRCTAAWNAGTQQADLTRQGSSSTTRVAIAVVEFTGSNWGVERVSHTYTASETVETETISDVGDLAKAFVHHTYRPGGINLDDAGQLCWISGTTELSFEVNGDVGTGVAWVIHNTQSGGTKDMNVQRIPESTRGNNTGEDTWTESITAVSALADAAIVSEGGYSEGAGSFVDRAAFGLQLTATDTVTLHQGEGGQTQTYRFAVVEWPEATGGGGTTFSETLTESVGATDALNSQQTFRESITESVEATDEPDAVATLVERLTESVSASDVLTEAATGIIRETLIESVTATDELDSAQTFVESMASVVRVADALNETVTLRETLVETTAFADVLTHVVSGIVSEVLTESVTATDQLDNVLTATVTLEEAVTSSDQIRAVATLVETLIEAVEASDQIDLPSLLDITVDDLRTLTAFLNDYTVENLDEAKGVQNLDDDRDLDTLD